MRFSDPDHQLIADIIDEMPEYCSCSCHASQHAYKHEHEGGSRHCKDPWHRCDPVRSMRTRQLQQLLHDMLMHRAELMRRSRT